MHNVRKLLADRSAADRIVAESLEALRQFALPPRLLRGRSMQLPFPATNEIGLILLHNPAQRFGVLQRGVEEPVPPSEVRRIRDVAALRGILHRLALRQGFPEQKPTLLLVQPLQLAPRCLKLMHTYQNRSRSIRSSPKRTSVITCGLFIPIQISKCRRKERPLHWSSISRPGFAARNARPTPRLVFFWLI